MRIRRATLIALLALLCIGAASCRLVQYVGPDSPTGLLVASVNKLCDVVEPPPGGPERTFHARFKIVEAGGDSGKLAGREVELALQPPDRLFVEVPVAGREFQLGRHGQHLWIYSVEKKFCLRGEPGVPRFISSPTDLDSTRLSPLQLPWPRNKLARLPRYLVVTRRADEQIGTNDCIALVASAQPALVRAGRLPAGRLELWLRRGDLLPLRVRYSNDHGTRVTAEAEELTFQPPWADERWNFHPAAENRTQTVALSHLTEFLAARRHLLTAKIPSLGPLTGERRVVATEGRGRLELIEGTRVLLVAGTPEEMGRQHGALLQRQVRDDVRQVLYGIGVGGSLARGDWFFGEMERAQQRLLPHMDARYLREMDALALAAGLSPQEVRMANLFPELFHCSGFAIYGDATTGGRLYHGRVLDYFRGQGLEQNAVVIVFRPDDGNAWVDISYAGFVGSVTAMNEKQVAIGEVGGRGEGQWDGKPMAQLVREVMERADTIDEAVEILRAVPRTCEYYYVISDGKSRRAVAIHATPKEFETAWAGETHPLVKHPIKDVAVVSGGDRYEELISRIKAGYGKFDAAAARELMTRPVCMPSNIHSVLFAPETLDFWVANADSKNPASHTRYTHYNLAELLGRKPAPLVGKAN